MEASEGKRDCLIEPLDEARVKKGAMTTAARSDFAKATEDFCSGFDTELKASAMCSATLDD